MSCHLKVNQLNRPPHCCITGHLPDLFCLSPSQLQEQHTCLRQTGTLCLTRRSHKVSGHAHCLHALWKRKLCSAWSCKQHMHSQFGNINLLYIGLGVGTNLTACTHNQRICQCAVLEGLLPHACKTIEPRHYPAWQVANAPRPRLGGGPEGPAAPPQTNHNSRTFQGKKGNK